MDINQICELDQYQEAALRTWNTNNDFGGRVLNAALGLTGEAGEVADIVKIAIFHGYGFDPTHCPGEEKGTRINCFRAGGHFVLHFNHVSRNGIHPIRYCSNEYI